MPNSAGPRSASQRHASHTSSTMAGSLVSGASRWSIDTTTAPVRSSAARKTGRGVFLVPKISPPPCIQTTAGLAGPVAPAPAPKTSALISQASTRL
jgi:hypothetical protein